jgi:hypothetical protein
MLSWAIFQFPLVVGSQSSFFGQVLFEFGHVLSLLKARFVELSWVWIASANQTWKLEFPAPNGHKREKSSITGGFSKFPTLPLGFICP